MMQFYLKQRWRDEQLSWNPDDFHGVAAITVPSTFVWTPDVTIMEQLGLS
jgi:hypothetical protein